MSADVGEDSDLLPEEKQVSLVATKDADEFRVHSEVTTVTRHLLAHSEFVEEERGAWYSLSDAGEAYLDGDLDANELVA